MCINWAGVSRSVTRLLLRNKTMNHSPLAQVNGDPPIKKDYIIVNNTA